MRTGYAPPAVVPFLIHVPLRFLRPFVVGLLVLGASLQSKADSPAASPPVAAWVAGALPKRVESFLGLRRHEVTFEVEATNDGVAWLAESDVPWLTLKPSITTGRGQLACIIDTTLIPRTGEVVRTEEVHRAKILVRTETGSVEVPVELALQPLDSPLMETLPGTSRVRLRSRQSPYVLEYDTAVGELTQIRPAAPEGEVDGRPVLHPRPRAFSAVINRYLGQFIWAEDGTALVSDGRTRHGRYDPENGALIYDRYFAASPFAISGDGASLIAIERIGAGSPVRRYALGADGTLTLKNEAVLPAEATRADSVVRLRMLVSRDGGLISVDDGIVLDGSLALRALLSDKIVGLDGQGEALWGNALLYPAPDFLQARVLPRGTHLYVPATRTVVTAYNFGLKQHSLTELALAAKPALGQAGRAGRSLQFMLELSRAVTEVTQVQLQHRLAGSTGPWSSSFSGFAAPSPENAFTIQNLAPLTTYEVRARLERGADALSPWSEVVTASTTIDAPAFSGPAWNDGLDFRQGEIAAVHLPATGAGLDWEVSGLPEGMIFDEDSQTLSGTAAMPGRYTLHFVVTNEGGLNQRILPLTISALHRGASVSRYSGRLAGDNSNLDGVWTAARSGDVITLAYRNRFFSRSARVDFSKRAQPFDDSAYSQIEVKSGAHQHVLDVSWDKVTDRLEINLRVFQGVHYVAIKTTEGTGLASHWSAARLPYPWARRVNGLFTPESAGPKPAPEGLGFFDVTTRRDGLATVRGETATGRKLTQTILVSDAHTLPLFLLEKWSQISGELSLADLCETRSGVLGSARWQGEPNGRSPLYPAGFHQSIALLGGVFAAPKKNAPLLPLESSLGDAGMFLGLGALPYFSKPVRASITPGANALMTEGGASSQRLVVRFAPSTGLVTGSFHIPKAPGGERTRAVGFRGLFVPDPLGDGIDFVGGYFLLRDPAGETRSGLMTITEHESGM